MAMVRSIALDIDLEEIDANQEIRCEEETLNLNRMKRAGKGEKEILTPVPNPPKTPSYVAGWFSQYSMPSCVFGCSTMVEVKGWMREFASRGGLN